MHRVPTQTGIPERLPIQVLSVGGAWPVGVDLAGDAD